MKKCLTKSKPEHAIKGSHYITYRYDDELGLLLQPKNQKIKQYATVIKGGSRWPKQDLIETIEVQIPGQLPIPPSIIQNRLTAEPPPHSSIKIQNK